MYRSPDGLAPSTIVKAAIYTRVSTDESLGMEFTALDAQREACEAYIVSQPHEGGAQVATLIAETSASRPLAVD
jgi:DNA invertase Pin-like site-specific DNA recombinase